jgi:hypothetical protein
MKRLAKKYAYLITHGNLDALTLRIRNRLWKLLTGEPFIFQSFHIIYPFNYLCSIGFRPQLRRFVYYYTIERNFESIMLQFEAYFNIFININEEKRAIINKFLKKIIKNDKFVFKNEGEVYSVWW